MFQRLSNSWDLFKASAKVLAADKELLVFPLVSAIGVALVSAVFIVPFFFSGLFDAVFSSNFQLGGLLVGFVYYVVTYTVIFFANTALVGAAMIRLEGGDPTLKDGIQVASKHFFHILGYALVAATVGVILNRVNEKSKGFGRFIVSLVGVAWNMATFLVVPVLAVEGIGPFNAIKRSVELLKKTWGEQIAGNLGLGAVSGLMIFVVIIGGMALGAGAVMLDAGPVLPILVGALTVLALVVVGLISSALNGIYTAAVYQYAASGEVGGFFEADLVKDAFRLKSEARL
jgi:hypothetical protein